MKLNYFSSGSRERVLRALLRSKHEIEGVFLTNPVRWPGVTETMRVAEEAGIPIQIVQKKELLRLASELEGRICLSVAFGYLFPGEFIRKVELCLNVHGTLLPKYAGARTLNWVLENNEQHSGVTVHRVD